MFAWVPIFSRHRHDDRIAVAHPVRRPAIGREILRCLIRDGGVPSGLDYPAVSRPREAGVPRRTARATYRDIGARFVAANVHPDHDMIATFRRENIAAAPASVPPASGSCQEDSRGIVVPHKLSGRTLRAIINEGDRHASQVKTTLTANAS